MPIVDEHQPLPAAPPIIVYYGEPGICKTSLANTSEEPLLIDFDRGARRSILRKKVLVVNTWEDVLAEEEAQTFKRFKTVIIDTAKACLDDFQMEYVCRKDYRLKTNKLQAYGAIGDSFKLFINHRRNELAAIIIIAHSKKDEDTKMFLPDVTGQSSALLARIADQIGFITFDAEGRRVIKWNPSNTQMGKNTARLPDTVIPDMNDPEFRDFNARLVQKIHDSISKLTEEQQEAQNKINELSDKIMTVQTPDELTAILHDEIYALPEGLQLPLKNLIKQENKVKGWYYSAEKKFAVIPPNPATGAPANGSPAPEQLKSTLITSLGNCSDVAAISELYMDNHEFIESHPDLQLMFNNATAILTKDEETAANANEAAQVNGTSPTTQAASPTPVTTAPQTVTAPTVDGKIFKKKYKKIAEMLSVLNQSRDTKDCANLYYVNSEFIEGTPQLRQAFLDKKMSYEVNVSQGANGAVNGTGEPKKEVANA